MSGWRLAEFNARHLPEIVGPVGLPSPDGIRVLDMPVKIGDDLAIPRHLGAATAHAIEYAVAYEAVRTGWEPPYVYVTLDQKPMKAWSTQRRGGFHSDGWLVDDTGRQVDVTAATLVSSQPSGHVDITYLAASTTPTLFAPGPWLLPEDVTDDSALHSFDVQAMSMVDQWWTPDPYWLVRLTPYCVHAARRNTNDHTVQRTFLKISLSEHRYNMAGNTHNHLLDYDWPMVERRTGRREHRFAGAAR